jgi:hypothetical protein
MQINEQKVGSVCNSLNAMEGAYRHKGLYELNTKLDHDTEFFLHQAQENDLVLMGFSQRK